MNSIAQVFATIDPDWMLLDIKRKSDTVKMAVLYLMRAATSQELSDYLKTSIGWPGQKSINFKNAIRFRASLQRDLKMYVFEAVASKTFSLSSLISKPDRELIQRMLKSDDEFQTCLVRQVRYFKKAGYKPQTLEQLTSGIKKVCEDLQTYCKMFIKRKMDFLVKSQALEQADLVNELLSFGIYAIYKAYPEIQDQLHMTNIAKTAIANRGKNIIEEATTKSRSRLRQERDGTYTASLLSIHSSDVVQELSFTNLSGPGGVMICNGMVTGLRGQTVEHEAASDVERKSDLEADVASLLARLDQDNLVKAKEFLLLLMGHQCEKFSAWLGVPDNEVYSDTVPRKIYVEQARDFLNIPVDKAQRMMQRLARRFEGFKNV